MAPSQNGCLRCKPTSGCHVIAHALCLQRSVWRAESHRDHSPITQALHSPSLWRLAQPCNHAQRTCSFPRNSTTPKQCRHLNCPLIASGHECKVQGSTAAAGKVQQMAATLTAPSLITNPGLSSTTKTTSHALRAYMRCSMCLPQHCCWFQQRPRLLHTCSSVQGQQAVPTPPHTFSSVQGGITRQRTRANTTHVPV